MQMELFREQLLSLTSDFATEKSKRDRRVSDLKRRLHELQIQSQSAASDLDRLGGAKKPSDEEIRCLQAWVSQLEDEIFKIGSQLADLKNEEWNEREQMIASLLDLNGKIRQEVKLVSQKRHCSPDNGRNITKRNVLDTRGTVRGLKKRTALDNALIQQLEGEYSKVLRP